jgi:hypothetical protein
LRLLARRRKPECKGSAVRVWTVCARSNLSEAVTLIALALIAALLLWLVGVHLAARR